MIELTISSCKKVVPYGSRNRSDKSDITCKLPLSWLLNALFVVRNLSAEEKFFVSVDYKGTVSKANYFSNLPKPHIIQFFKGLEMKFSLDPELSELIASQHEEVAVGIDSSNVTITTGNEFDFLPRHDAWLWLLKDAASFILDVSPHIDYFTLCLHLPDTVKAA